MRTRHLRAEDVRVSDRIVNMAGEICTVLKVLETVTGHAVWQVKTERGVVRMMERLPWDTILVVAEDVTL